MQLSMFLLTYANYGVLHATRSSWSLATKDLLDLYGFDESTIAWMNSDFLFFYSVGGFFLSHLGDRVNKNRLIFVMYIAIALTEVFLGCLMFVGGPNNFTLKAWPFFFVKTFNGTL